ncbi:potassium transporter Kup [Euzebya rosea]|uniref:potassium transporter Kup n=1 Tax=Euzebya rosea TaxID=2052804 RepID=UPI000D3E1335|nr:potassium transporter Kup [Euzebya rosea]
MSSSRVSSEAVASDDASVRARQRALALAALGIVFGDIGTSPLYAFREALAPDRGLTVDPGTVIGAASVVIWALLLVIAVKYLMVVMRADAHGEGGILALTSLLGDARGRRRGLVLLGLFGTALLYGDGAITPAISVLSAVEGLEIVTDALQPAVLPVAIGILVALFSVQYRGTAALGAVFGRVMLVWFAVLAVTGLSAIVGRPEVLRAFNPIHAIEYLTTNGMPGFLSLGAIFLVVTGGEALYADMGHFGRRPIARGWFAIVMPALMLNYLGQAALLIGTPEAVRNPFFLLAPGWARIPLVVLATAATVIASQALISGVFSLSVQAVQLNYLPRVKVHHTSDTERGQVYLPALNVGLLAACIGLVLGFRTSANLAAAYGVAVTATMVITTLLFVRVAIDRMGWRRELVYAGAAVFLVIDLAFLGANLFKIADGGWFPLLLGGLVFAVMTTWHTGRRLVTEESGVGLPVTTFLRDLGDDVGTLPGTAVYLYSRPELVPPALLSTVRHFGTLHERIVLLTVEMREKAHVPPARRLEQYQVAANGHVVEQVVLRVGFRDRIDVPAELRRDGGRRGSIDPDRVSFFLGRETVRPTAKPGMALWRERLFGVLLRNSTEATAFFGLPAERTTTVGRTIEI